MCVCVGVSVGVCRGQTTFRSHFSLSIKNSRDETQVVVWVYVDHLSVGDLRSQRRALNPLKLKLQEVVTCYWVMGAEPQSSARAVNTLCHWAISQAPIYVLFLRHGLLYLRLSWTCFVAKNASIVYRHLLPRQAYVLLEVEPQALCILLISYSFKIYFYSCLCVYVCDYMMCIFKCLQRVKRVTLGPVRDSVSK